MNVDNLNISKMTPLRVPKKLKERLVLSEEFSNNITFYRQEISDILTGKDNRLICIVGPCSIHNEQIAIQYAKDLKKLAEQIKDKILIVMRVYFEKPRTTVGWKGLINDPDLNNSYQVEKGLELARRILLNITEIGLPIATEFLDPIVPQYTADLISWTAIGARTTESQTHREMASGLSMPVGFKNSTDGSIQNALNAIQSSSNPQNFLGINQEGQVAIVSTTGNPYAHAVLRGGSSGPNYDSQHIKKAKEQALAKKIEPAFIVDCSHANSGKDHNKQPLVLKDIINQINNKENIIKGFMLESNINEDNQPLVEDISQLKYGVSITDKCLSWKATQDCLLQAYKNLN